MFKNDDSDIKIQLVKRAMRKNKNLRLKKRYMVIFHYLKGYQNCEITEMEFFQDVKYYHFRLIAKKIL